MAGLEQAETSGFLDFCQSFEDLDIQTTGVAPDAWVALFIPGVGGAADECARVTVQNLFASNSDTMVSNNPAGHLISTHTDLAGNIVQTFESITTIDQKTVNDAAQTFSFRFKNEAGTFQTCNFDISGMFAATTYLTCDGTTLTATDRILTAPTGAFATGFGTNQADANGCLTRMDLFYNLGRRSLAGGDNYLANEALGYGSVVGNGLRNTTTTAGSYGGVFTGNDNEVAATRGAILTGSGNDILPGGSYSAIGSGINNQVSRAYSFVGSGNGNDITGGSYHFIGSGLDNQHLGGSYSSISGGYQNRSRNSYNQVSGYRNEARSYGQLVSGYRNDNTGNRNIVAGDSNIVRNGTMAAVFGFSHDVSGGYHLLGGYDHTVTGNYNTSGGIRNRIAGSYQTVFGNTNRTDAGVSNTLLGTSNRVFAGSYSFAAGRLNNIRSNYQGAIGFSHDLAGVGAMTMGYNNASTTNYTVTLGRNLTNTVQDGILIANNFQRIGVFGKAPVPRQTLAANPTGVQIRAFLQAYGWCI